jgi:hypothetical protein
LSHTLGATQADLRARFKRLTEIDLPDRAQAGRWRLRLDHCFKRVCLDWACGDCWYGHLERPAERHLEGEMLERAVLCAEELLRGGANVLQARNKASLRWRGKLMPRGARASDRRRDARQ